MKRTSLMKLQKPDAADPFTSNTYTENIRAMNKMMGNLGGEVIPTYYQDAVFLTTCFELNETDFTFVSGAGRVNGDGTFSYRIWVNNKKDLPVSATGLINNGAIGTFRSAFKAGITQPATSYSHGPAFGGFTSSNPTNLVLRIFDGYVSDAKIAINTTISLTGTFPLENYTKGIGLEDMPAMSFNNDTHIRNLLKIDAVASRLAMKDEYASWNLTNVSDIFTLAAGITLNYFTFQKHRNGNIDWQIGGNIDGGVISAGTGDIGNIELGVLKPGYRPKLDTGLRTTHTYLIWHGTVDQSGIARLAATIGKGYNNTAGVFRVHGTWVR